MDMDRPYRRFVIAAGILVRDSCVLLVENHWPDKIEWTLPGGMVEPAERIHDALQREFREETSLDIVETGPLGYVLQNRRISRHEEGLVLAFHVRSARGALAVGDDEDVRNARFVPMAELPSTLTTPMGLMPLTRCLQEASRKVSFYYFDDRDGETRLRFMT